MSHFFSVAINFGVWDTCQLSDAISHAKFQLNP